MVPTKKGENKKEKEKVRKNKTKMKKVNTKPKRTHFQYTEDALAQALDAIRNKNMAVREACRKYCVPRSTVQDRISGRIAEKPRKVGPEPLLGFDGEQKIVDWIVDLAKCGIPVNKQQLLDTVKNIIKDLGKTKNLPEGKKPGQTWYQNFLRRHPEISVREPENINKARESVKESSIRKWFEELESFITERGLEDMMKDPDRILNADETGVSLCPATGKVLAPKGYKNVYTVKRGNEKETLTVLITMTASGKICPPLVVFPYIRPPKAVVQNMPEGWVIGKTESGWMRSDVFYEFIANDFNDWLEQTNIKKPVILFVDGHKSHMSMALSEFCENNEIILYALPPNTTHITQPADVSVFRPLKQEWKKTVSDWQSRPENHNSTVNKTNFCKVFKEALDKDLTQSIKNGFRKCGLFPFNVEAVDFSKCVKDFQERRKKTSLSSSELTERDFIGAHRVITYIKSNLLRRGVDPDVVCKEIELAKNDLKEHRRSTSKTPRTSTEVARLSTSYSLEQTNTDKRTDTLARDAVDHINSSVFEDITNTEVARRSPSYSLEQTNTDKKTDTLSCNPVDNINSSVVEDITIPEVGSYVSLNDIELINISDLGLELHSDKHNTNSGNLNDTTEPKDSFLEQELLSSPVESVDYNSKITVTTVAEVYNDTSLQIETLNEDETFKENIPHAPNQDITIDPFKKHLIFDNKLTDTKTKTKNIAKFPSAISAKKWRDYYESKDKEKQKNVEEKNKRKAEREQKKIETAAKKRKKAEEKKLNTKQCKKIKNTDKMSKIKKTDIISTENNEYTKKDIKQRGEETTNDGEIMQELSAHIHQLKRTSDTESSKVRRQLEEDIVEDFRGNIQKENGAFSNNDEDYSIFSAKKLRDYDESKDKEKQKKNEEGNKSKEEPEEEKIETAAKKRKKAEEKKLTTKQCKNIKKTDIISKIKKTDIISTENNEYTKKDIKKRGEERKNDGGIMQEVSAQIHQLKRMSDAKGSNVRRQLEKDIVEDFRGNIQKEDGVLSSDDEDYSIF